MSARDFFAVPYGAFPRGRRGRFFRSRATTYAGLQRAAKRACGLDAAADDLDVYRASTCGIITQVMDHTPIRPADKF